MWLPPQDGRRATVRDRTLQCVAHGAGFALFRHHANQFRRGAERRNSQGVGVLRHVCLTLANPRAGARGACVARSGCRRDARERRGRCAWPRCRIPGVAGSAAGSKRRRPPSRRGTRGSSRHGRASARRSLCLARRTSRGVAGAAGPGDPHPALPAGPVRARPAGTECATPATRGAGLRGSSRRAGSSDGQFRGSLPRTPGRTTVRRQPGFASQPNGLRNGGFGDLAASPAVNDEVPGKPAFHVRQNVGRKDARAFESEFAVADGRGQPRCTGRVRPVALRRFSRGEGRS